MSTLEEKLEQGRTDSGKARCKLSQINYKLGYRVEDSDALGPLLVSVSPMYMRTYWRRIAKEKGDYLLELEREVNEAG